MKQAESESKPLITHRWQLPSIEDMLDKLLPEWRVGHHPDFSGEDGYKKMRGAFSNFARMLLFQIGFSMEKAAAKGINEALAMIQDPDYYKTVKRRTRREIQRDKEAQEQRTRDRERWERCELTEDERRRELGRIAYDISNHEGYIQKLNERKLLVETCKPIAAAIATTSDEDDGNDEWPDSILFD